MIGRMANGCLADKAKELFEPQGILRKAEVQGGSKNTNSCSPGFYAQTLTGTIMGVPMLLIYFCTLAGVIISACSLLRLPKDVHIVAPQLPIVGYNAQGLDLGLGYQHAVERVPMVLGLLTGPEGMLVHNGQYLDMVSFQLGGQKIFRCFLKNQSAQGVLDGDLPCAGHAPKERVAMGLDHGFCL